MKLMILNLPRQFSENDLAKLLKTYGNIRSCSLVLDTQTGNSKGFGFVEMATAQDGATAIKELNGKLIQQKKIRVKAATA